MSLKNLYSGLDKKAADFEMRKKELEKKAREKNKSFCFCPTKTVETSFGKIDFPQHEICPICNRLLGQKENECDFIRV